MPHLQGLRQVLIQNPRARGAAAHWVWRGYPYDGAVVLLNRKDLALHKFGFRTGEGNRNEHDKIPRGEMHRKADSNLHTYFLIAPPPYHSRMQIQPSETKLMKI